MFWNRNKQEQVLGILAGVGELPRLFAQNAVASGKKMVVFGIEGVTDKRIDEFSVRSHYFPFGRLEPLIEKLKLEKIKKVVFVGGIPKKEVYNPDLSMDGEASKLFSGNTNKGDDHLLRAFELLLKLRSGASVIDGRDVLKGILANKGVMTSLAPNAKQMADIRFGFHVARQIGKMDIGQTIVVKNGIVLSVEALEGTDDAIQRAESLAGAGVIVVKTAKPNQNLKFDLPCIGPKTIDVLTKVSAACLAVEAGKTLMLFKEQLIQSADKNKISIVGV